MRLVIGPMFQSADRVYAVTAENFNRWRRLYQRLTFVPLEFVWTFDLYTRILKTADHDPCPTNHFAALG